MLRLILRTYNTVGTVLGWEEAQDLPEYAFVVVMLALGSIAGMNSLATGIWTAFGNVSSDLSSAIL
jgi:Flp pilus assembly pilin Flp